MSRLGSARSWVAVTNAERIKLTTLRSPLWAAATAAGLSVALAALQASTSSRYSGMTVPDAALGAAVFGVPVLMVVAAMTVTGEYRTGLIRTTFLAAPHRTVVLCAKALVAAVFTGGVGAAMTLGAVLAARIPFSDSQVWRTSAAIGLYAALAAVLAVGVAALVRHAAGAVAALLLWPLLVEPLLGNLPGRGAQIGPWLPFANAFRFLDVQWLFAPYAPPWGELGSLCYFVAVVFAVFIIAVMVVQRRDA